MVYPPECTKCGAELIEHEHKVTEDIDCSIEFECPSCGSVYSEGAFEEEEEDYD